MLLRPERPTNSIVELSRVAVAFVKLGVALALGSLASHLSGRIASVVFVCRGAAAHTQSTMASNYSTTVKKEAVVDSDLLAFNSRWVCVRLKWGWEKAHLWVRETERLVAAQCED